MTLNFESPNPSPIKTREILHHAPRWRILNPTETATYPYIAIASLWLLIKDNNNKWQNFPAGTGWFVTPTRVVTAAHVVNSLSLHWNSTSRDWALQVTPGISANQQPLGITYAKNVVKHSSWDNQSSSAYDLAIIDVANPLLPQQLCLTVANTGQVSNGISVLVAGYPSIYNNTIQVACTGPVQAIESHNIFYNLDTDDGQSGCPVLITDSNHSHVLIIGIHCGGRNMGHSSLPNSLNCGLWFRPELYQWIHS